VTADSPSPSDLVALQERVVLKIVEGLPQDWSSYELEYEYYVHDGELLEQYKSRCFAGGRKLDWHALPFDALALLPELHAAFVKAGREPWTHIKLELARGGSYEFNFLYGVPPLAADDLKYRDPKSET
jgi:hypothetical protein